jgi:hypothetical protein
LPLLAGQGFRLSRLPTLLLLVGAAVAANFGLAVEVLVDY